MYTGGVTIKKHEKKDFDYYQRRLGQLWHEPYIS